MTTFEKNVTVKNCFGLTKREIFDLEISCLNRLEDSYNCICGFGDGKTQHFPIVIKTDDDEFKITMSYCGYDLENLPRGNNKTIPSVKSQINCIINNLENAGVLHLDFRPKNFCFTPRTGTLVLIDFNIAVLKNEKGELYPENDKVNKILNFYINPSYKNRASRICSQIFK